MVLNALRHHCAQRSFGTADVELQSESQRLAATLRFGLIMGADRKASNQKTGEVFMSAAFWSSARAAMLLDPSVINLNTGSFGPLPRVVFERVTELRRRLAEEPMDFLVRQAPSLLWKAREKLASFTGCDPRRLVFTANVTAAVNLVAASLMLAAPGEILLTDHEYGAMHWCWERAARRL